MLFSCLSGGGRESRGEKKIETLDSLSIPIEGMRIGCIYLLIEDCSSFSMVSIIVLIEIMYTVETKLMNDSK